MWQQTAFSRTGPFKHFDTTDLQIWWSLFKGEIFCHEDPLLLLKKKRLRMCQILPWKYINILLLCTQILSK